MAENTELTKTDPTDAPVSILGGVWSSIHAATREQMLDLYDAVSDSESLEDMVNQTISVQDVILQPVEMADERTGEVQRRNRIVLVTPDGKAYGCVSSGIETSMRNLFAIVGMPPWTPAIDFTVVKKTGRNGYKFMSLKRA